MKARFRITIVLIALVSASTVAMAFVGPWDFGSTVGWLDTERSESGNATTSAYSSGAECSFSTFLSGAPEVSLPLTIEHETVWQQWDELEEVSASCSRRFLEEHLPNFNGEQYVIGFGNFNFPPFDAGGYRHVARFSVESGWAVVFALWYHTYQYAGLATYTEEGSFIDQILVAGSEGGSGARVELSSSVLPNGVIELTLLESWWDAMSDNAGEHARRQRAWLRADGTFRLPVVSED